MTENIDIKKRFKIILPNEWSNRDKGKFWEDVAAPLWEHLTFANIDKVEGK